MDTKKLRIVFMGTPQFAVPCLDMLKMQGYNIVGVFTKLDKPSDKLKVVGSAVKQYAVANSLPVFQYAKLKSQDGIATLKNLQPDIVVTAAFGQLLNQEILDIPTHGVYNVHASLLPKYRGGCPIQWCIIDGSTQSGITIMRTELGLDTGPMLLQKELQVDKDELYDTLYARLSYLGADLLAQFLQNFGALQEVQQDNSQASYQRIITKQDGQIDWNKTATQVHNHIRGVTSNPGAYTHQNGKTIKVWKTQIVENDSIGKVGQVLTADPKQGLVVQCKTGSIRITELQIPNKKRMQDTELLKGNRIEVGSILGV